MAWRDKLRPPSFRGVPFKVKDRTLTGGRAIDNHEYPKRDINFAEDMGRDTRKVPVDAYVIGDDYMDRRDALIAALEKEGPGTYVDQWGLSLKVVVDSFNCKESQSEGRIAHFSIKFIEAGANSAPFAVAATAAQLVSAATGLQLSALTAFAGNAIVGQAPASIAAAAGVTLASLPQLVRSRAAGSPLTDAAAGRLIAATRP